MAKYLHQGPGDRADGESVRRTCPAHRPVLRPRFGTRIDSDCGHGGVAKAICLYCGTALCMVCTADAFFFERLAAEGVELEIEPSDIESERAAS